MVCVETIRLRFGTRGLTLTNSKIFEFQCFSVSFPLNNYDEAEHDKFYHLNSFPFSIQIEAPIVRLLRDGNITVDIYHIQFC